MKLNAKEYPLIDCIISGRVKPWKNRIHSCDIEGMMYPNELSLEKTLRNNSLDLFEKATCSLWPMLSKSMRENLYIVGYDAQIRLGNFLLNDITDEAFLDGSMIGGGAVILQDKDRRSYDMYCWLFQDQKHFFLAYLHNGSLWDVGSIQWGDDVSARFYTRNHDHNNHQLRYGFASLVSSSYFIKSIKEDIDAWGIVIPPRSALRLEGDMFPTRNEFNRPFTYIN